VQHHPEPDFDTDHSIPAVGNGAPPPASARHPTSSGALPAELVALTHTLALPLPVDRALGEALLHATRLLPIALCLRLFTPHDHAPRHLTQLWMCERAGTTPDAEPLLHELRETTTTLGYGTYVDQQVLDERQHVRQPRLLAQPLLSTRGGFLGALAIELSETVPPARYPDPTYLSVIQHVLAALLARRTQETTHARMESTLHAAVALASPAHRIESSLSDLADNAVAQARAEAETQVLRDANDALAAPAATFAVATLVPSAATQWRPIAGDLVGGGFTLSESQAAALHGWFRSHDALTLAGPDGDGLWQALAPLRATAAVPTERITLLPVRAGDRLAALFVVAHAAGPYADVEALALAGALAAVAGASIYAIRLAERTIAEMRGRDAFISLTAHELRTPLTSIKGYAQLLMRQARKHPLPESVVHSIEAIDQQSQRLAEMISELLDASRIHRGKLDVNVAPADIVPLARHAIERRQPFFPLHQFVLETSAVSVIALVEAPRVEQVIRDLLDNAARHTPSGDRITVTISQDQRMALVEVQDAGIGVDAADRERIFEYLYRAPRSEQRNLSGLGLGLFVSKYLIERMGGQLWLHTTSTEPPTGSDFHFTLPLA
jgi:signal transduction histidine kinase